MIGDPLLQEWCYLQLPGQPYYNPAHETAKRMLRWAAMGLLIYAIYRWGTFDEPGLRR